MILLGLETLAVVYIVKRVTEKNRAKANSESKAVIKGSTTSCSDIEPDIEEKEKKINHYLTVNTLGTVTSLAGNFFFPIKLVGITLISYSTVPILKNTECSLFEEKRIKNDLLNSIVSIICIGTGQYFAAGLVTGLYHFGDKMVLKTRRNSNAIINNAFQQQTSKAWLLTDKGVEVETDIETLQINDVVVVSSGHVIPIDGKVIEGAAMIDQQALTGESELIEKSIDEHVLATTLVISGKILVRVEYAGIDTAAAKICEILKHTADYKTSIQSNSEQWADKVALPLIGVSCLFLPFIGVIPTTVLLYSSPGNSIKTFASLQTFNYLIYLSKQGILVKDGRALEQIRKVDTVLFDKTGTLTTGQPIVGKIIVCDELNETQILSYAAAAEHKLTHPVALAILKYAKDNGLETLPIEDSDYQIGYGIRVNIGNDVIQVGSLRFMEMGKITIPSLIQQTQEDFHQQGHSLVAVAVNKQIKGAIEIKSQLKPNIKTMLKRLRENKIEHIGIVSGDHQQPTQKLAEELEMDSYFYDALPQDKATIIENLQKQGKTVCFIGDGINDSIAIKQANVSISFSDASAITADLAQVVFMESNISQLPVLFEVSEKLSFDTKNILAMLGGIAAMNSMGAIVIQMRIVGSVVLQVAEGAMGFGYSMRPLRTQDLREIRGQTSMPARRMGRAIAKPIKNRD